MSLLASFFLLHLSLYTLIHVYVHMYTCQYMYMYMYIVYDVCLGYLRIIVLHRICNRIVYTCIMYIYSEQSYYTVLVYNVQM